MNDSINDSINDIRFRAQMAAVDPDRKVDDRPVPVLTTLMIEFCGGDNDKFSRLCNLIEAVQDKTLELARKDA